MNPLPLVQSKRNNVDRRISETQIVAEGDRDATSARCRNMLKYSPVLRDQAWVKYVVKETDKGPIIWEVKECTIYIRCESRDVPMDKPFRLVVA